MSKDWDIISLGNICINLDNQRVPITKNKRISGNIPYYGASGIVDYVESYIFDEDLLLVSEDGANLLARTYPIAFSIHGKSWVNNHAHVLKFESKITQQFVEYYLNSIRLDRYVSGMAQPKLNKRMLNSINIPVPKIKIQKQIVEILDKAFEAIDKAKENLEKNIQNSKELFQSRLNEIFSQKGEGWEESTILEICKDIFAGGDKPKENFSKEKTEKFTIPIFANAVKDKGLYGYTNKARVNDSAITISARGSGTGHTEIRTESFFPIVRLIVLVPNREKVSLIFLKYIIDNLDILRSGSAIPQLTVPMIKEYKVNYPSLKKQNEIIDELENIKNQTKQLEEKYQQKLQNLEELKKSILQKAFSGELV